MHSTGPLSAHPVPLALAAGWLSSSSSFKVPALSKVQNVSRTKFEIKKGTGFFFYIHDKFVTDFPYCQVFDKQFFVLNVKQIRKFTISFGLLIQMEGKF